MALPSTCLCSSDAACSTVLTRNRYLIDTLPPPIKLITDKVDYTDLAEDKYLSDQWLDRAVKHVLQLGVMCVRRGTGTGSMGGYIWIVR